MSDFNYKKYLKNNPLLQKEAEENKLITEEKTTTEEIQTEAYQKTEEAVMKKIGVHQKVEELVDLIRDAIIKGEATEEEVGTTQVLAKYIGGLFEEINSKKQEKVNEIEEEVVAEEKEMSSKMKKSELKSKIKEDIISLLQEDEIEYETPLEEEEEEVEIDIEDKVEVEEPELDASVAQTGLSDDEKDIQDALKLAYDNAQAIGDEKLADQIGNSITFFTRTHVVER